MSAREHSSRHEEAWLLLPWLANGRLAPPEREWVEDHLRSCPECEQELTLQRLMCTALAEPDRVTYAPGPSLRKLMDRIDNEGARKSSPRPKQKPAGAPVRAWVDRLGHVSLWRPPGLAWAASFLVLFGVTGLVTTAYRWTEPAYRTHTDSPAPAANILHIAFDRSLTIGDVEELLRTSGARIVEGPGNTGIFGVTAVDAVSGQDAAGVNGELRKLSARLRADSRVLWVQPLPEIQTPADEREPVSREH